MDQKFCEHCGAPLNEGDEFCRQCGAKINPSVTPNSSQEMKSETSVPTSSVNTRSSFILSIIGLCAGSLGLIFDIICLCMPLNSTLLSKIFLKFLSLSLETSVLGIIFSLVGLLLNKPNSFKNKLSKNLSIVGISTSSLALIGYFIIYIIAMINTTLL